MSQVQWPKDVRKVRPSVAQRKKGESYGLFNTKDNLLIQGHVTRKSAHAALDALGNDDSVIVVSMDFYTDSLCGK